MDLAQKAFCGYMLLCGSIFVFAPQMPTTDTFGSLEKSPDAFGVSCIYAQVVGCLMFMMLFQQCPGPRGLLLAIAALGANVRGRHMPLPLSCRFGAGLDEGWPCAVLP